MLKVSIVPVVVAAISCGCDSSSSSPAPHSALETCARLSACGLAEGILTSFGQCRYLLEDVRPLVQQNPSSSDDRLAISNLDCVLAASTCDELRACSRPTPAQLSVCDTTAEDTCVGNVLVNCSMKGGAREVTAYDCAKAGLVCGATTNGALCGVAPCDPATTPPKCEGSFLVTCEDQGNVLFSVDCSGDGQSCSSNSTGLAVCAGSTPCDPASSDFHCDGTTMVRCDQGTEARTDCATLGPEWTCHAEVTQTENTKSQSISCVPVAQECSMGGNESCADGVITYCDAGHLANFDCRSVGFSGCSTKATSTTTVAGCVQ